MPLSVFQRISTVVGEIPQDIFSGEPHEQHCDFRVSINKTAIEVGKPEERHYVPDFTGLVPVLDGLDFVLGHREAIWTQAREGKAAQVGS